MLIEFQNVLCNTRNACASIFFYNKCSSIYKSTQTPFINLNVSIYNSWTIQKNIKITTILCHETNLIFYTIICYTILLLLSFDPVAMFFSFFFLFKNRHTGIERYEVNTEQEWIRISVTYIPIINTIFYPSGPGQTFIWNVIRVSLVGPHVDN